MKRITTLICGGIMAASCAFAQTAPPVTPVVGTTPATGTPAAAPGGRPARVLTPEQQAAAKARTEALNADYQNMMDQLHITTPLRPGKNGNDKKSPDYANYDETKANPYTNYPNPLIEKNGKKVTTANEWWTVRRPQIVEDFNREVYGRVPKNIPKVTWSVHKDTDEVVNNIPVNLKQLVGHVDNSAYPAIKVDIQLTLMVPKSATHPVPVIMVFGGRDFLNPPPPGGGFGFGGPRPAAAPVAGAPAGAPAPGGRSGFGAPAAGPGTPQQQVLTKGWAYAELQTGTIQADNGGELTKGIIGLVNKGKYRKPDDWGVLRAWAWGADRALDYFESNPAVNAKEVAIEGHSRWGKAALVSLAYDPRMATAYVSSSGEAGAKPSRRTTGEVVENITGTSEYHWMAGNFLKYGGPLNPGDLPVDSHELIAMCAPRPVFISGGSSGYDGQDAWVDAPGMFMACNLAGPVYTLLGKRAMAIKEYPGPLVLVPGDITFRQHSGPHTDIPNWPFFLEFASLYFK